MLNGRGRRLWGWGMGSLACGIAWACSGDPAGTDDDAPVDRDTRAPEHCVLARSPEPFCDAASSWGGAGGAGGAGPEDGCLVNEDITLVCPSQVGELQFHRSPGTLDVVYTQAGRNGQEGGTSIKNDLAYVEVQRIFDEGSTDSRFERVAPFQVATPAEFTLALLPQPPGERTWLLEHRAAETHASFELAAGSSFGVVPPLLLPFPHSPGRVGRATRLPSGRSLLMERSDGGLWSLFDDVTVQPSRIDVGAATALALSEGADGELRALVQVAGEVELRSSDLLEPTSEAWSLGEAAAELDLLDFEQAGEPASVGLRVAEGSGTVFSVDAGSDAPLRSIATVSDTCPAFSIGISCDDCPEGDTCEERSDVVRGAQLFLRGERLFVAYVSADRRLEHRVKKDTNPILGCSCGKDELSNELLADQLVVKELTRDGEGDFTAREVMRLDLGPGGEVAFTSFERGPSGGVSVFYGPALYPIENGQAQFTASEYRWLGVGVE